MVNKINRKMCKFCRIFEFSDKESGLNSILMSNIVRLIIRKIK